ncbi:MAG: sugar-binding protein [Bacteroidales bacterium]|nr:sugar-binding protein [Bacteroidales bacterium]
MIKKVLFLAFFSILAAYNSSSQCGRISLIGEFNGWNGDHFMTRHPEFTNQFATFITVKQEDDPDNDGDVEMKFRENANWTVNWGSESFPSGIGYQNGPNIPVPYGNYYVTFDCVSGTYNFQTTCGTISLIGEFNDWNGDLQMSRDEGNIDFWTTMIYLSQDDDYNEDGIVEMRFRQNADWNVNWGNSDFPSGIGVLNGWNIPVPIGHYKVEFNCSTGEYNFISTCGDISLIGEFNEWGGDIPLIRDPDDPDIWTLLLTLTAEDNWYDPPDIIEMKFRQNADWSVNWGDADFPSGIGYQDGPNIPVPLDQTGFTTDYLVTFKCTAGEYHFEAASGPISIIGAFNAWNGDVPMNRDDTDPNLWKLSRSWYADSEIKFRENNDWMVNWGNTSWPSGTGIQNGPNIPLVQGKYDVIFNTTSSQYNFILNPDICGEIGLIGDFNNWGTGDPPADVWMVRDPVYPSNFSLEYHFTANTGLLFRMDADPTFTYVWGGNSLCQTGIQDPGQSIQIPAGHYTITFNCKSGDYCFEKGTNSVVADKVFSMYMDGILDENDWKIDQPVSKIVDGIPGDDLNTAEFGVTYNDQYLYVGIDIWDAISTAGDCGEIFIDGNLSGGAYDEYDLHLKYSYYGIEIIYGPAGMECLLGTDLTTYGFSSEIAIPLADLNVNPLVGNSIGFDIILSDDDTGTGVEYKMAWNGGTSNYGNTSSFGDLAFGNLSCGCISIFNPTIGDVILRNPTDQPTTYVGTYDFDDNYDVIFRKDQKSTISWGSNDFPYGTGTLGGPPIPATAGRYRVSFDCLSGEYSFYDPGIPAEGVAYADYTDVQPIIDGDLSEYNLQYGSEIQVDGSVPENNTVEWGAVWDQTSLYVGTRVTDEVVEGSGNPWDNDAIEYYLDGNNDKDGQYDSDFDTQIIQDYYLNWLYLGDTIWMKIDGLQLTSDHWDAKWIPTDLGYNVELRLSWSAFDFLPGRGRVIGWSLGNDDSDKGVGRDYQTVWFGTGSNWSNTADLGELQLAGGPYVVGLEDVPTQPDFILYPNPADGHVNLRLNTSELSDNLTIYVSDITGRTMKVITQHLNGINNIVTIGTDDLPTGMYIVNITTQSGMRAVKKLIVY